jgi:hypothetical protein
MDEITSAIATQFYKVIPYFLAYKTHRPIRRTVIFSLGILEKNND